jgi:hypothetical protein
MDPDTSETQTVATRLVGAARRAAPASYELGDVLGMGGMGEVLEARDLEIGRSVALKRLALSADDEAVARFLREAKIQARLDHPAIVPVYEIGRDADGNPYFTMKRLAGTTLHRLLGTASLQRVLRAFVDVCLAVGFAHERKVVHRDLKPANIMLGDYGEVYVLDWGVAHVLAEPAARALVSGPIDAQTREDNASGTPGYMAPEQVRGESVGPAADVYALGAILFEVLAGAALHPGDPDAARDDTLATPVRSPAAAAPARAIAPELDAACIAALAADAAARPTARALGEQVQCYLDGDRDVDSRRRLAAEHLGLARAALGGGDRAGAMFHAGRAFALDRDSTDSGAILATLVLEPPRELPAALTAQLADSDRELAARQARSGTLALAAYFLYVPFMLWIGIRDWAVVASVLGFIALWMGFATWRAHARKSVQAVTLAANVVLMTLLARMFGPVLVVPGLIVSFCVVSTQQVELIDHPWYVVLAGLAALGLPIALEQLGVVAPTWWIDHGDVVIRSAALVFDGRAAAWLIVLCNVGCVVVVTLFTREIAAQRRDAQRRLEVHAWHLRQLLPRDVLAR